jgi:phosphoribosylformimino-5-aminoimidazole carboxamide ribotide isomerase
MVAGMSAGGDISAGVGVSGGFTVYPAIDVLGGKVVRLRQGDYARETAYDDDPLAVASRCAAQGARWLHLVDLEAARDGGYTLAPLLARIKQRTGLSLQTGGGVRAQADVERLLDAGADRLVVGSLAVRAQQEVMGWLGHFGPERIVVALDARCDQAGAWRPAVHGWTETAHESLDVLVREYAREGMRHLLCTDIGRDGMLTGPNLELYGAVRQWAPDVAVQASGGVRDVADVVAVRALGCAGAVLGKSLLEGRLSLREALAC